MKVHKAYEEAMNRKAHRYALLKAAKEEGKVDWVFTEHDWTALKAGDTGEELYVTVRMEITKDKYLKYKNTYERMQRARQAKGSRDPKGE